VGECEQFLRREYPALARAAWLLTGDRTAAEDLVQETAVRVVLQWRRVARADAPGAYVRRVMLNAFLGGRRRSWHGELPTAELPESGRTEERDDREALRRALLALPPRQRAAVVLRHWEDRTEAETAALLGCSTGNVKALTSRGLAALRASTLLDGVREGS
jgi:RNA polymerase sigma-70 factor (sigma-E family)